MTVLTPRRAASSRAGARARAWLPPVLLLAALLGVWQGAVAIRNVPPYVLPSPARIAGAFVTARSLLPRDLATTTVEAVLGLVVGAGVGALLAGLVAAVPPVRRALYPLLVVSQTIPMIVLAPLLVLWFGYGITPKVVVVALIVFFPVVVSTVAALAGVDPELIDLVRSMGADRMTVLRMVLVPAAIPAFFAGLRISAAYAVAGAVVGEWVGAQSGLGIFIDRSKASFRIDRVFVAVVMVAVLSMALFAAVGAIGRMAAPWQHAAERGRS
ncbi:MAG: ABC transporter permease [Mycobacteriales bacterium]|nr:MAG: ABC transporter permease [Pseudonocardiales bacterium]